MSDLIVKCPTCQRKMKWTDKDPYRPFCSERCKILDLGEWASDNRYIPTDTDHDDVSAADLNKD